MGFLGFLGFLKNLKNLGFLKPNSTALSGVFLLVLIELFSLGVTAEAPRAKIDKKIGDFDLTRSV